MYIFSFIGSLEMAMSIGLSVGRSVCLSVCRSVLQKLQKKLQNFTNIPKTLQNICKDRQGSYYDITKCYKTLQNRLPREMNSLQKTPQYSLFAS